MFFLVAISAPALAAPVPTPESPEELFVTGLRSYPIRENPQFSDPALVRIPVGRRVTLVERKEGWVKIDDGEHSGWILASIVGKKLQRGDRETLARLKSLEGELKDSRERFQRLSEKNRLLNAEKERLAGEIALLEEEGAGAGEGEALPPSGSEGNSLREEKVMLTAMAGGLLLLGFAAGYIISSFSHHRPSKVRYKID